MAAYTEDNSVVETVRMPPEMVKAFVADLRQSLLPSKLGLRWREVEPGLVRFTFFAHASNREAGITALSAVRIVTRRLGLPDTNVL